LHAQPFDPELKIYKPHGRLAGLWACEVYYDCRIFFCFESERETEKELIALADIGTHDAVY
jgi:mRNA-degrading endonuclease YafQ of YafQ-DinJ toxin-antitoxin module